MLNDLTPQIGSANGLAKAGADTTQGRAVRMAGNEIDGDKIIMQPTDYATAKNAQYFVKRNVDDPDNGESSYETITSGTRVTILDGDGKIIETDQCKHDEVYSLVFGDDLTITITGTVTYSGGASAYTASNPNVLGRVVEVVGSAAYVKLKMQLV